MVIARVYFDQDMRCAFQGFKSTLRKDGVSPDIQDREKCFIFMNRACTKFKLMVGGYLVYYNNGSRKIPLDAIQYLPTFFDGKKMNLDQGVTKAVIKSVRQKLGLH